tara:strand:+ start:1842 stop:2327 length:486 start_codon:yes stop_codon:yes gene_type:complete
MCELLKLKWYTGKDTEIEFDNVTDIIKEHLSKGAKVFIGTDSFISKSRTNFATAICLYGGDYPSRYFFSRQYVPKNTYKVLVTRITEEVRRSVEMAEYLMENHKIKSEDIELHIDVSPFQSKAATSKFSDMLRGYVTGAGFECKLKPDAWASQSVADKHSK